jgi:prepilin-type N-terminal cleavage/methylation domain-containing protein
MTASTSFVARRRSGFTLFEAVVALTIVGLVAVATLAAVGTQLRTTDQAKHVTEASVLAEERLASAQVLSASDLQSLPAGMASGRFPAPFDAYTWRMTSVPVRDVGGVNNVTVSVDWADGSYMLASRIYRAVPLGNGNSTGQSNSPGGGGGGGAQLGGAGIGFQGGRGR